MDKGVRLLVKFEHANTVANPTLNINSTGATSMKYNGANASASNTWADNEVVDLYYDGSYYILMPCLDVDDEPTAGSDNLVKSGGVIQKIADFVFPLLVKSIKITNGSSGNIYNTSLVHTECIYIGDKRKLRFYTSRPNRENCEYRLGISLSSSPEDIGSTGQYSTYIGKVVSINISADSPKEYLDLSEYTSAIGLCVTIGEYDTSSQTSTLQVLRASDFEGYDTCLVVYDEYQNIYDTINQVNTDIRQDTIELVINSVFPSLAKSIDLTNGSVGNPSNANLVHTECMFIGSKRKYKFYTSRPNREGCEYRLGIALTSNMSDIGKTSAYSTYSGGIFSSDVMTNPSGINFDISDYINAIGMSITIGEFDSSTSAVQVLRASDFENYNVCFEVLDTIDDIVGASEEETEEKIHLLSESIHGELYGYNSDYAIVNGSQGNPSNSWVVCIKGDSSTAIPVKPGDKVKVTVNKSAETGFSYYMRIVTYTKKNPSDLNHDYIRNETGNWNTYYESGDEIQINDGEYGLSIQLTELTSAGAAQAVGTCIALRATDFSEGDIDVFVAGITNDIEENSEEIQNIYGILQAADAVVGRNADRISMLTASCRYRKSSETSKDFQLMLCTDSHGDTVCVKNAIAATNGFDKIDALVHCGDCVADIFTLGQNNNALWKDIISGSSKPCYFVMGNHEKGTYPSIYCTPTDNELYNAFIKPLVDNEWLANGEYTVNKNYWFHDFAMHGIRLITIDEYEAPCILDDTYWEAIPYDSSLTAYATSFPASISQGTEINVKNYTTYSFRAKQNITGASYSNNKGPCYKYRRGYRWISQTQAEWFLDKLATTPNGYKVIVACHNPFSDHANVDQTRMFSQKNNWVNGAGMQNYMTNDFIADAINAFVTKTTFNTTCASQYPTDMPSYNVSKDFSSVVGTFHSLIGGHVHQDCIWKHQTYNQYQVTPICANSKQYNQCSNADIRRSSSNIADALDVDCLTVVSFGSGRLGLVKLGANVTENGTKRDYEVININS